MTCPRHVQVARARGVSVAKLVNLNQGLYPGLNSRSKLLAGTRIWLADPAVADLDADCSRKDTPRTVAARTRLPLDDLLAINAARFNGGLEADSSPRAASWWPCRLHSAHLGPFSL